MQHPSDTFINRRGFIAGGIGLTALALVGRANASAQADQSHHAVASCPDALPADFQWGVATAAYQIEGATEADGRKPSIWDTFCRVPGRIAKGDTGDIACDHYHRFAEDVALMADLGVKHYRFSISWSRVIPDGRGAVNEKGLDFYRRLADELLKHSITPHATLYHWDLPQALQDRYAGWESREITADFSQYAAAMAKGLGDRITHWMTLNEVSAFCYHNGYGVGRPGPHAPGIALASARAQAQLLHHALLAHGLACQAIRAASPAPCTIAVADNFKSFVPTIETPANIKAAERAFVGDYMNGAVLLPLLTGRYDEQWLTKYHDRTPEIRPGDMETIGQPLDTLGFNCYSGTYVQAADNPEGYEVLPMFPDYPKGNLAWLNIVPEAAYWGIRLAGETSGRRQLPIFLSENGIADGARPNAAGAVNDTDRIMYCRAYLRQVQRAVSEGYPVSGYFHWSLLDNFEWAEGYSKRFGMILVDFKTQRRTPKLSYRWFQQVIRENRIV